MFGARSRVGRVLAHYDSLLVSHPWSTKALTSGVIAASGDVLAQTLFPAGDLEAGQDSNGDAGGNPGGAGVTER